MNREDLYKFYDFSGRTVAVTGGAGVLCSAMVITLARLGAKVAVLDRIDKLPEPVLSALEDCADRVALFRSDVLDKSALIESAKEIHAHFGPVDTLINGAGGNKPAATTSAQNSFFDLPADVLGSVFDLNLIGTILPSQVFGQEMAAQKNGVILNISSMNAFRPLTRIPAYSAAKAGVSNFTQWLAVHMAQEYSPNIRVNAIAPGFLLGEQNRFLLIDKESGNLTPRGQAIISHTPMNRFGVPEDLLGTVLWLLSPASAFITGIVVPIDGGFSAFSGV
jgi:NAD(P)-dependent dehydrogenase (short-subunit alcohol dehydrogenase family)